MTVVEPRKVFFSCEGTGGEGCGVRPSDSGVAQYSTVIFAFVAECISQPQGHRKQDGVLVFVLVRPCEHFLQAGTANTRLDPDETSTQSRQKAGIACAGQETVRPREIDFLLPDMQALSLQRNP